MTKDEEAWSSAIAFPLVSTSNLALIKRLRERVLLDPASALQFLEYGFTLEHLRWHEEAFESLSRAAELDSSDFLARLWAGAALRSLGRDEEALLQFERVPRPKRAAGRVKYQEALSLLRVGRSDQAMQCLEDTLAVQPKMLPAYLELLALARNEQQRELLIGRVIPALKGSENGTIYYLDLLVSHLVRELAFDTAERLLSEVDLSGNPLMHEQLRFRLRALRALQADPAWSSKQAHGDPDYAVFVISLARDAERRRELDAAFGRIGVPWQLISAVDGADLSQDDLWMFEREFLRQRAAIFDVGALGCWLSHMKVWREICDRGIPHAVVLEDDARPRVGLPSSLGCLSLPTDYDLIYLSNSSEGALPEHLPGDACCAYIRSNEVYKFRRNPQVRLFGRGAGTYGYLISLAGARKLLGAAARGNLSLGIDAFMDRAARRLLVEEPESAAETRCEAYCILPSLIDHVDCGRTRLGRHRERPRRAEIRARYGWLGVDFFEP